MGDISALIGLFIGYFSDGLMVGIVYIKIIMILFLAPPIFFYLTASDSSILFKLSYLLNTILFFTDNVHSVKRTAHKHSSSIRRDKMCILTFLLPVVVGIAVHLLSRSVLPEIRASSRKRQV